MGFEENLDAIAPKIWNLEFIFNSKSKQLLISIHDHIYVKLDRWDTPVIVHNKTIWNLKQITYDMFKFFFQ